MLFDTIAVICFHKQAENLLKVAKQEVPPSVYSLLTPYKEILDTFQIPDKLSDNLNHCVSVVDLMIRKHIVEDGILDNVNDGEALYILLFSNMVAAKYIANQLVTEKGNKKKFNDIFNVLLKVVKILQGVLARTASIEFNAEELRKKGGEISKLMCLTLQKEKYHTSNYDIHLASTEMLVSELIKRHKDTQKPVEQVRFRNPKVRLSCGGLNGERCFLHVPESFLNKVLNEE